MREETKTETLDAHPLATTPEQAPEALVDLEQDDVDLWTQLENEWQALVSQTDALVADFVSVGTIEKEYDDPILLAVADEEPTDADFDDDEDWDDSAFAVSGVVQPPLQSEPVPQTIGFGDYAVPDASIAVATPPVASTPIPAAQSAPQYVALNPPVPTNQSLPRTSRIQSTRKNTTPEERLEAAKRAGAQIVELSPEQYRRAVAKGLGTVPQGR